MEESQETIKKTQLANSKMKATRILNIHQSPNVTAIMLQAKRIFQIISGYRTDPNSSGEKVMP